MADFGRGVNFVDDRRADGLEDRIGSFSGFSGINEHEIAWEVLLREMAG